MSISALVIFLLLPGFLGFWVFKRSVQEDLDKRSESTQVALASIIGFAALATLFGAHFIFKSFTAFSEYVSPYAFSGVVVDADLKFWSSYAVLCVLAMLIGAVFAFFREKLIGPIIFSTAVNKLLKRSNQIPCESALSAFIDKLSEKDHGPSIVKVYTLGENREKPLIGWFDGYSESEKEIKLSLLEFCENDPELNKILVLQPRRCVVNYNSGIVMEFLDVDAEHIKDLDDRLREKYRKSVAQNMNS